MITPNHNKGFIALMSAIVISCVLLSVTLSAGIAGIFGRLNVLDAELKSKSEYLAESCVSQALYDYASLGVVDSNKTVIVGQDQCTIISVDIATNKIQTTATFQQATTNREVVVTNMAGYDFSISSWQECKYFSAGTCIL